MPQRQNNYSLCFGMQFTVSKAGKIILGYGLSNYKNAATKSMIHETTFTFYALSIKGGFYNGIGQIVDDIGDAKLFKTPEEAKSFRKIYDPTHYVTESTLLMVHVLVSEVDYES